MKNESGFTLVELMVVVAITCLLLTWGIPSYSTWNKKHNIENQMVQLYSNLQFARMNAYSSKVVSGVWWGSGASLLSYQIRYDANNNGTIDDDAGALIGPKMTMAPQAPVTVAFTPAVAQNSVSFDGRGFLNVAATADPAAQVTFFVASGSGAATDCVIVASTKVVLGKMSAGNCLPK